MLKRRFRVAGCVGLPAEPSMSSSSSLTSLTSYSGSPSVHHSLSQDSLVGPPRYQQRSPMVSPSARYGRRADDFKFDYYNFGNCRFFAINLFLIRSCRQPPPYRHPPSPISSPNECSPTKEAAPPVPPRRRSSEKIRLVEANENVVVNPRDSYVCTFYLYIYIYCFFYSVNIFLCLWFLTV